MNTSSPKTVSPDEFLGPFAGIINDVMQNGEQTYIALRPHMRHGNNQQSLKLRVVDDPSLNAWASVEGKTDYISVNLGAVERIFGAMFGLMSTPQFFPTIGESEREEVRKRDFHNGLPPMPLIRRDGKPTSNVPFHMPNDKTRLAVAHLMADISLSFLIHHEIGHIVGGHCELLQQNNRDARISEVQSESGETDNWRFRQALECDADLFASDVALQMCSDEKIARIVCDLAQVSEKSHTEFAMAIYFGALHVLFRMLRNRASVNVDTRRQNYPHPVMRSAIVWTVAMARGMFSGTVDAAGVERVAHQCIRNIKEVWTDLVLPGQCLAPPEIWRESVQAGIRQLLDSYAKARPALEQYSRLRRCWDDFEWTGETERLRNSRT